LCDFQDEWPTAAALGLMYKERFVDHIFLCVELSFMCLHHPPLKFKGTEQYFKFKLKCLFKDGWTNGIQIPSASGLRYANFFLQTFTGWANNYLKERILRIKDIEHDLADGIMLINLLEIISHKKLPKYSHVAKTRLVSSSLFPCVYLLYLQLLLAFPVL